MGKEVYHSRVYTDRPPYADYDAPMKFQAIESIIAKRLVQHPNAICSYSGGADSDILIDLIERVRKMFSLPPVQYVFFNTGLEMQATKDHVKATAEKYGVEIRECRPKKGFDIVSATRRNGQPFVSKIMSAGLEGWQKKQIPLSIAAEYEQAEDKAAKRQELKARYPGCESTINFLCCCNSAGEPRPNIQLVINSSKYMRDFIAETPPTFKISAKCCECCKKDVAHRIQKDFDMVITGERRDEGGMRSVPRKDNTAMCFTETADGKYRLRPLYYVSDADKAWYKEYYGIKYSDAYEVYGLTRTGCCGCPISYKAVDDLESIRPFEPTLVKAAWNVFGDSYRYRQQYNAYKAERQKAEKERKQKEEIPVIPVLEGQESLFE
jgi:3'-phosphoadenosine 5'-phosphosulfate sulfotransferase (PAPS reductase)/FAD synthetase